MELARRDLQGLGRIVVVLVALAAVAERAGGASFPVRWLLLVILRQAEAVAQDFVLELLPDSWPDSAEPLEIRGHPDEALWLAWRLMALAAVLVDLVRLAGWDDGQVDGWTAGSDGAFRHSPAVCRLPLPDGGWMPKPDDTS